MSQTSQTLADGLAVLRCMHAADRPLTKQQIAEILGIERTKVHRLVNTLHEGGFVGRQASGTFVLTPLLSTMASARDNHLRTVSGAPLTALAEATGMTAHVSVCDGDIVTALRVVPPINAVFHVGYREGTTHPVDRGAAGIVILAARDDPPIDAATLDQIRSDGYAITHGALQAGAVGIAMALTLDDLEASIGVVTLGTTNDQASPEIIAALNTARRELTATLK